MLTKKTITYQAGSTNLIGLSVASDHFSGKRPAVIVFHDWSGRNAFAEQKAELLAGLGYIGFAADMYGDGATGQTREEKSVLMLPLLNDRPLLLQRLNATLDAARNLDGVDTNRIAAIGFCFGGLCVLDLARSGALLKGIVSFHGLLTPPKGTPLISIQTKVLALHGYKDPLSPLDEVLAFGREMTDAKADWQIHMFGQAMHAFTNPEANDHDFGTVYDRLSAERAWQSMQHFLAEIL